MKQTIKKGIVWFDIETPVEANDAMLQEGSALAQIASLVTDYKLNVIDEFEIKIRFKKSAADPRILAKIGYDADIWEKEAVMPNEAAAKFIDFVFQYACVTKIGVQGPYQAAILAGHNIRSFDIPVLYKWYEMVNKNYGLKLRFPGSTNPSFDTRSLVGLYGFLRGEFYSSESLTYLCGQFGIDTEGRHDALADLYKTIAVAKFITKNIQIIDGADYEVS